MKPYISSALLLALGLIGGLQAQSAASPAKALGTPASAITIEVYSDFQCPYCKVLHETVLPSLIRDYVRTGRAYLIQRDFPMPMHTYAKVAACYACAAERVGKYEQVCDALFNKQTEWEKNGNVEETACSVLTPAEAVKVRKLAKDASVIAEVENDRAVGVSKGVDGTPTMLVSFNGKKYPINGAVSYSLLSRFLDSLH